MLWVCFSLNLRSQEPRQLPSSKSAVDWCGPLFIVGPSRTGSVMLREILNGLPDVGLFNETHYFDDFRRIITKFRSTGDLGKVKSACHAYHEALAGAEYSDLRQQDLLGRNRFVDTHHRQSVRNGPHLADMTSACDSIFADFCRDHARLDGSKIWGEKTPRHVYRIDDILSAFPNARFICTVRDSRATVASYRNWSRVEREETKAMSVSDRQRWDAERQRRIDSYHPIIAALMWRSAINAARRASVRYGDQVVRFVQFEKLVAEPHHTISELASWIGVPFDKRCLSIPMQNSSFFGDNPASGIATAPVDRWKTALSADEIGIIEFVTGRQLESFGYERNGSRTPTLALGLAVLTFPGAILRATRANRARFGSLRDFVWKRVREIF
ncbi:MAG: sulfotransferase [Rhodobacterales bacterium]|nr:sulfotransferase [Rhodobacterales bacterium]